MMETQKVPPHPPEPKRRQRKRPQPKAKRGTNILRAAKLFGSPYRLALAIGTSHQAVEYWLARGYAAPQWYKRIEKSTRRKVTRLQLLDDVPDPDHLVRHILDR